MEVKEAVRKRRSIRAFESKPVSKNVLKGIMEHSLWAPSWGNTQSWGFTIVSGNPLDLIKKESLQLFQQGVEPNPEIIMPSQWDEIQTARYQSVAKGMFDTLDIKRDEKEKRNYFYQQGMSFFGAPHMIYLHLHKGFNQYALLDGGLILQTIALLAVEEGLGTCFMAMAVTYPEVVRKHTRLSPDRTLVVGLAIGYPVSNHPLNLFRSQRGNPEEFIQWVEK